jgi:CBS domain-containing protein
MTYCKDIMTANPACCVPNDDVQHVSQMMRDENVGAIPVVEDHQSKKLLGIITDRDITVNVVAQGNNGDTKVRDVMTSELVTCHAQDDVHQATEAMAEHQITIKL